jgi:hypothetical protein
MFAAIAAAVRKSRARSSQPGFVFYSITGIKSEISNLVCGLQCFQTVQTQSIVDVDHVSNGRVSLIHGGKAPNVA